MDLAPDVRRPAPGVLFGGMPPRMMRLGRRGAALLSEFEEGPVEDAAAGRFARTLTDAGIAVLRPGVLVTPVDVTVVIPVRDRPAALMKCLASLGSRHRVLVVDDGSIDTCAVATVCREGGAELVRRARPGGPAAARNTGLSAITTELVMFVDSDCLLSPGTIESLAAHLVDPLLVGIAPRIVPIQPGKGPSLLDMGTRPGPVGPRGVVPYVPAAAVLFRRAALGDGYDERFRYGEDVDLVWRLVEVGWRIGYVPDVEVGHRDPTTVRERLRRRFVYGTSVGPLERAHPGTLDHLVVGVGPACTVATVLLGAPSVAACIWAVSAARLCRRLRPLGVSNVFALRLSFLQVVHAWVALARWCTTFGVPLLAAIAIARRGPPSRRALGRGALLAGSALVAGRIGANGRERRLVVDGILGETAYGLGVVTGCVRTGAIGPLIPRVGHRRLGSGAGWRVWLLRAQRVRTARTAASRAVRRLRRPVGRR